ncbi:MAG: Stp1/IreP family PP2C-type Ser/Thr phosphatase [Clostridia bacterium]|nr:Stp1/IreP family PP2C-type Ser/Thr phosphatase [Clostridia bacterium]
MKYFVRTDIGKVRSLNEDAYYLPREGECFCAIADGMGGHNAGEVASAMAVDVFSGELRACASIQGVAMREAVEKANAAVFSRSISAAEFSGMGTTFTALAVNGENVHIAHVGDSRAYLIRNGCIMCLTLDHTLVQEMVLQGLITPREAKYHPKRNYITRALGTDGSVEVDLIQIELQAGDVFFLCTDGLSNHVEDRAILEITQGEGSWEEKLGKLIQRALDDGGSDNITAMYAVNEEEHR